MQSKFANNEKHNYITPCTVLTQIQKCLNKWYDRQMKCNMRVQKKKWINKMQQHVKILTRMLMCLPIALGICMWNKQWRFASDQIEMSAQYVKRMAQLARKSIFNACRDTDIAKHSRSLRIIFISKDFKQFKLSNGSRRKKWKNEKKRDDKIYLDETRHAFVMCVLVRLYDVCVCVFTQVYMQPQMIIHFPPSSSASINYK